LANNSQNLGLVTAYWHKGGDYCDTADFKNHLSNCLKCALTQDVWQWYGEDVKNAANKCHVDATPSTSSAGGSSPNTASVTISGGSTSSLTTATSEASTSNTVCPAVHISHLFPKLIFPIGYFVLGVCIHFEDFRIGDCMSSF
jgi:hypothetical protein